MTSAAEALAQRFHETYERLAPKFGYETREASAVAWVDVPDANRALMIATCAELLAASPSGSPTAGGEEPCDSVAELIVAFIEDTLSGGNDLAFRHTMDHDGPRSQPNDEDGAIVWINAPIGDPDEPGSLDGESFTEAMVDFIRRAGTPNAVAELDRATRRTTANRRASTNEDTHDDASEDAGTVSGEAERDDRAAGHVAGDGQGSIPARRVERGQHVREMDALRIAESGHHESGAARQVHAGADVLRGLHASGVSEAGEAARAPSSQAHNDIGNRHHREVVAASRSSSGSPASPLSDEDKTALFVELYNANCNRFGYDPIESPEDEDLGLAAAIVSSLIDRLTDRLSSGTPREAGSEEGKR